MRRIFVKSAIMLLAAWIVAADTAQSVARITITPAERCSRLSRQVDKAIGANATDKQVAAARALQVRGNWLCTHKKRAQGIRTLAKALKLLGAKPEDID